jgi:hypothetical protein
MYRDNYGVSLHHFKNNVMYGILPMETKYDSKKNFIGFDLPSEIKFNDTFVPIAKNIETWNNTDVYNAKENFMPMYKSDLYGRPAQLVDAIIGIKNEEMGINLALSMNNEQENNDNLNNCIIE